MIFQSPARRTRFLTSLAVWSFFSFSLTKLIEPTFAPLVVTYIIFIVMSVSFAGYFWLQYRYTLTFSEFALGIVLYNSLYIFLSALYNQAFVADRFTNWSWFPALMIVDFILAAIFFFVVRLFNPGRRAK